MSSCDPIKSEIKSEIEEIFIVEERESIVETDFCIKNEWTDTRVQNREGSGKKFRCPHCPKAFAKNVLLKSHLLVHTDEKRHKCGVCKRNFRHLQSLQRHNKIHVAEKPYVCKICKTAFRWPKTLKAHTLRHTGEKPHVCEVCRTAFRWRQSLKSHMIRHAGDARPKFQCHDCLKIFNSKNGLKLHSLIHSSENLSYACEICNTSFSQHRNLTRHMLQHMGDRRPTFECPDCPKIFTNAYGLKCHSTIHTGEKSYECDVCKKAFRLPITLKRHTTTHADSRPHLCKICNKAFRLLDTLRKHMKRHMGETRPKFECPDCPKVFVTIEGLKRHSTIHAGEKLHKCEICNKAFMHHSRKEKAICFPKHPFDRHSCETRFSSKQFVCSICPKAFDRLHNLTAHFLIHKGERQCQCQKHLKCRETGKDVDSGKDGNAESDSAVLEEAIKIEEIYIEESAKEEFDPELEFNLNTPGVDE